MTKLNDIPGAGVLPYFGGDMSNIHLEVDVEAMVKIIVECSKVNVVIDGRFETSWSTDEFIVKALADNIPKWARLVRK